MVVLPQGRSEVRPALLMGAAIAYLLLVAAPSSPSSRPLAALVVSVAVVGTTLGAGVLRRAAIGLAFGLVWVVAEWISTRQVGPITVGSAALGSLPMIGYVCLAVLGQLLFSGLAATRTGVGPLSENVTVDQDTADGAVHAGPRAAVSLPSGLKPAMPELVRGFNEWLDQHEQRHRGGESGQTSTNRYVSDPAWRSFDRFLRESLLESVGARRVRAYEVLVHPDRLRPLAGHDGACLPESQTRSGIIGWVLSHRRRYLSGDCGNGELMRQLVNSSQEQVEWAFPVRRADKVVGLVTVGDLSRQAQSNVALLDAVAELVGVFWNQVLLAEQLRLASRTDRGSGVLNRTDFLSAGSKALTDSYACGEPVVLMGVGLEGIRRLDDEGQWGLRDWTIRSVGQIIDRNLRSDDVVGRFSDDRFVVLLRRLDLGLGRLIAKKIHALIQTSLSQKPVAAAKVAARCTLACSGRGEPGLEELLVRVFGLLETARREDISIRADADEGKASAAARYEGSKIA